MSKPTMAKRHFELIAATLQSVHPDKLSLETAQGQLGQEAALDQWLETIRVMADSLAPTNAQFKRDRFIRACQPGANVRARS